MGAPYSITRLAVIALVLASTTLAQTTPPEHSRPNIVFILADNVGYGVLSSYNGGILDTPTPRIDSLAANGLRLTNDNTLVVWASDYGPSPLPTVTPWWTIGDSGPWRGEIGTVLEGNIRTSCILRWPSKIPDGRVSNQIVSIEGFFPTIARIAGGKVPTDRPIDGVDQLDLFMGHQEKSNREYVLLFLGQKLMAIKWRNYKIHLDGIDRVDGVIEDWSFPRAFNLSSDPKERWNIIWQNSWIGEEIGPLIAAYAASVKKYPNLAAGQPDDHPPHYGKEEPATETEVEGVQNKLESMKQQ